MLYASARGSYKSPARGKRLAEPANCGDIEDRRNMGMTTIRIASVNGEWMNNWFTSDGTPAAFLPSFKLPGENIPNSTDKTASRLAAEIKAIDPDVLALEEAPSRKEELDLFVSQYLSGPAGPNYNAIL